MQDGHTFKGYLPGGASGGILPASMADIPLDFGTLEKYGCFVGSHAVVILSDKDDMKAVALNLMKFFEDESCGQCTPCRVGTEKAVKLMAQGPWNEGLLDELSAAMRDASICGLGPGGIESADLRAQIFPRRTEEAARHLVTHDRQRRNRPATATTTRAPRAATTRTPASRASRTPRRSTRVARAGQRPRQDRSSSTARKSSLARARRSGRSRTATASKIPHLCYSPEPGYRADGNCRACMVEIEGERVLAASCIRKPAAGMKVKSQTTAPRPRARWCSICW